MNHKEAIHELHLIQDRLQEIRRAYKPSKIATDLIEDAQRTINAVHAIAARNHAQDLEFTERKLQRIRECEGLL